MTDDAYSAILLAGQRPGPDPLARKFGLRAKALTPIAGAPMIDHALAALRASPRIGEILILADPSLEPMTKAPGVAAALDEGAARILPTEARISDSVAAAMEAIRTPDRALVTTADNVLLSQRSLEEMLAAAGAAEIAVGMVERRVIEAACPGTKRTYYRFRDASVSGANLFLIDGPRWREAVAFWRHVEANRKRPLRIFAAFGWLTVLAAATGMLTLEEAFRRGSARLGCRVRPVLLSEAEAAIDVDKPEDHELVSAILERRAAG